MKRIVNGVTYNTETSTRLAESRWQADDEEERFGTLYQTRGGAFFVDVEITKPVWNEREEQTESKVTNVFEPMSPEKAHEWILTGEVEIFHNPFDDPPEASAEAEPAATIYIRVPASLKQRVDEAAGEAKMSGNAWAMRCIEHCMNNLPATHPTLMKAIDTWFANLPDEILEMWRAAPVGNHRPNLARFAADQAYRKLLAAIAGSKTE